MKRLLTALPLPTLETVKQRQPTCFQAALHQRPTCYQAALRQRPKCYQAVPRHRLTWREVRCRRPSPRACHGLTLIGMPTTFIKCLTRKLTAINSSMIKLIIFRIVEGGSYIRDIYALLSLLYFWFIMYVYFLVAYTQLYKRLCPLVRRPVRHARVENAKNAHLRCCSRCIVRL